MRNQPKKMKKILVAGDVEGNFDFLLSKIDSLITQKQQHFDFCLCIGKTLSLQFNPKNLLNDNKQIPIPIYFIDCSEFSPVLHSLHPDGVEIIPNLTFLGKSGITQINNISIAFLSGKSASPLPEPQVSITKYNFGDYNHNDINNILIKKDSDFPQGIDILLTNEWPEGFDVNLSEKVSSKISNHSVDVSSLVAKLSPRYHFVGLENFFYKRPPYQNDDKPYITRLIGLGKVPKEGASTTQQYIFALQLKNIQEIPPEELAVKTSDTTSNPYTSEALKQAKAKEASSKLEIQKKQMGGAEVEAAPLTENIALYFQGFDKKSSDSDIYEFLARWGQVQDFQLLIEAETGKHKGTGFVFFKNLKTTETALKETGKYSLHGRRINFSKANKGVVEGGKLSQQNAECWFCLNNPNAAKELIVYIGSEFYVALDKGPINPHHLLLIPIDHHPSTNVLPLGARDEMDLLKRKIVERYEDQYDELVMFYEKHLRVTHNIAHMILNAVSYPKKSFDFFIEELDKRIKRYGFNTFILAPNEKVKDMIYEGEYYVYIEAVNPASLRDKEMYAKRYLIIVDPKQLKNFPRDLGREVYCDVMNCRNKINWKDAILSEGEVKERTQEMKKLLSQ